MAFTTSILTDPLDAFAASGNQVICWAPDTVTSGGLAIQVGDTEAYLGGDLYQADDDPVYNPQPLYLAKIGSFTSNEAPAATCLQGLQIVADTGVVQTVAESGVPQPIYIGACP